MILLYCILAVLVLIFITLCVIIVYSGLLSPIDVKAGRPPIRNLVIAYKFATGPYKNCGDLFTEVCSIAPKNRCIGIYYDDPTEIDEYRLRYCVGTILAEGAGSVDDELLESLILKGFKLFTTPDIDNCVHTTFPHTTPLSIHIAILRVYPKLGSFIKENRLSAHPCIEVYQDDVTKFIAPLARQDDFYVPEAVTAFEEDEEDLDDVSDADTTGRASANTTATSLADKTDFTDRDSPGLSVNEENDSCVKDSPGLSVNEENDSCVKDICDEPESGVDAGNVEEKAAKTPQEAGAIAETPLSEGLPSFENVSSPSESEPELINLSEANSPSEEVKPLITITEDSTLLAGANLMPKDQDQGSEKSSSGGSSYEELHMGSDDVKQYEEYMSTVDDEKTKVDISEAEQKVVEPDVDKVED